MVVVTSAVAPRRVRPPQRPIRITLDGRSIVADAEASLAAALVAEGEWALARSPKFHRPRGPACMRGGCDGCLMRVDDVPNVMTCLCQAQDGARVERQNVLLSPKLDLLRATDWFFPHGMNHHEMFAGIPGIQGLVQAFARRVSGLGELPEKARAAGSNVETVEVEVLVVGAGLAGLEVARGLAAAGRSVLVCDDRPTAGGAARGLLATGALDFDLSGALETLGTALRCETTAFGVLEGGDWLLDHPRAGLLRVRSRAQVVATGGHDAPATFPGNDIPGVISARAALALLDQGVLVGTEPVVVGDGPHARAFAAAARGHGATVRVVHTVTSARGLSTVKSADVVDQEGGAEHKVDADAVVHDAPPAPCFELAVQAGAEVTHGEPGYSVRVDAEGRTKNPSLFAVGEVTGARFEVDELRAAARRTVAALLARGEQP